MLLQKLGEDTKTMVETKLVASRTRAISKDTSPWLSPWLALTAAIFYYKSEAAADRALHSPELAMSVSAAELMVAKTAH